MDDNSVLNGKIHGGQAEEHTAAKGTQNGDGDGGAWTTVARRKRGRKLSKPSPDAADVIVDEASNGDAEVSAAAPKAHSDAGESVGQASAGEDGGAVATKAKRKKKKKRVTVAAAASKIDAGDLGAFLVDISESYESQQDVQLIRFADYFGRAFANVRGAQFPWLKTFKESTVAELADIPLLHIPKDVYNTSTEWIGELSFEAVVNFLELPLDSVLADLESHLLASKGSKNLAQQVPSKSPIALFVVLAMALRGKPNVLISFMKRSSKFEGEEKLPLLVWLITQASAGDLCVGLYTWARFLLPLLESKSTSNPHSRDLILQLIQRIVSAPKARSILLNGAWKMGERVVPPSALDMLLRVTFPESSARVEETERFEAVYPVLKEVALAGSSGSKGMKQATQQIFDFAVKAIKEDTPDRSKEASEIFFWCLKQDSECYKQWDLLYLENLEASVFILRKLSTERNEHSDKHIASDPLKETLESFREKNVKELRKERDDARRALLKDAEKYNNLISGRKSGASFCTKSIVFVTLGFAVTLALLLCPKLCTLHVYRHFPLCLSLEVYAFMPFGRHH